MNKVPEWVLVICGVIMATAATGYADTVGLWLFDRLEDTTLGDPPDIPNPPGGDRLYDSGPNELHFTAVTNFGFRTLETDLAPVMSPGRFSLYSVDGGASQLLTPSSAKLHRGNTGAITIEFWYKPPRIEDAEYNVNYDYVMAFDGNSDQTFLADWGVYKGAEEPDGSYALHFFDYSAGTGFFEFNTGKIFVPGGPWQHIAIVIDAAGDGTLYVDGQSVATLSFGVAIPAVANIMRLGANANDGNRAGVFFIDELRISDTALPPGNGTGVDELAWNASLYTSPQTCAEAIDEGFGLDADFNDSCYVDMADLDILVAQWLQTGCTEPDWCEGADLTGDGEVAMLDFAEFVGSWQSCIEPTDTNCLHPWE